MNKIALGITLSAAEDIVNMLKELEADERNEQPGGLSAAMQEAEIHMLRNEVKELRLELSSLLQMIGQGGIRLEGKVIWSIMDPKLLERRWSHFGFDDEFDKSVYE